MQNQRTAPIADPRSVPRNYVIQAQIGEGGYGLVYKATQTSTGQNVAIKMLKLDKGLSHQKRKYQLARFERETRLCAELNHPHIVQLLDKGVTGNGTPYAVFEYVHGQTLKEYLAQKNGLSAIETGELMGQVLDALASAHSQGIVHRDLKPHNIMVSQTGSKSHIKILDFGIGAFTKEFRKNDYQSLTLTREVLGTPGHTAPEQLRGEPATVKSDLYAWGLITIECLTGEPVMKGDSVAEIFQQQLDAANVPLPSGIAGHPLADLLRRVLHKNVRQRAGEAASIYQDFKQINFNSLVGKIATIKPAGEVNTTLANEFAWQDRASEKRQVTILCFKLSLWEGEESPHDLETLDTMRKHQIDLCKDVAVRYGGHVAGSLANHVAVYFGYPKVSDNDARRAGRTALEIHTQVRRRSALLHKQHDITMEIRMGMHTGPVLTKPNQSPEGTVPNTAFNLLYSAAPGSILVSDASRKLLDPFLEFEPATINSDAQLDIPDRVFTIAGERQTEALSFLRPWSANREMIGREVERDQIFQFWEKAKTGSSQIAILHGQAGIGKSKMVYELKKQVRSDGYLFRECRCLPEHRNNALYPFLNMLRNHWGIADMSGSEAIVQQLKIHLQEAGCNLDEGLPILCIWLSVPLSDGMEVPALPPDAQRQILFKLLYNSIVYLGQLNPFLLVLEDLHWLDPTSHEFIEFLLGNLEVHAILLLMTTRPAFTPDWDQENLFNLHLAPLNQEASASLAQGVLQGRDIEGEALSYLHERADGIPLYIEELTRMLVEDKFLIQKDDSYALNIEADVQDIPMTLHDLLNARLGRLGTAKESAQLAAVIGREFSYALLVQASLKDEASIQTDLQAMTDMDLVYRQRRVQDESYIFRHALIRDAAYEGMVGANRKESHLRVASTLENYFPKKVEENPFEVARHLAEGESYAKGTSYGIKAVEKQVTNSANEEAIALSHTLRRWIDGIDALSLMQERTISLNTAVIPAHMSNQGYADESILKLNQQNEKHLEALKKAGVDITHLKDQTFRITYDAFTYHHNTGNRRKAAELRQTILNRLHESPNRKQKMGAYGFIGQSLHLDGRIDEALEIHEWILSNYNEEVDIKLGAEYGIDPKVCALMEYFQIGISRSGPETSLKYAQECYTHAHKTSHDLSKDVAYTFLAIHHIYAGNLQEVAKLAKSYEEEFSYRGEKLWVNQHFEMCVHCAAREVSFPESYVAKMLSSGQKAFLSYFEPMLANVYLDLKEPAKAIALMRSSIERCEKVGEFWTLPYLNFTLAKALFAQQGSTSIEIEHILGRAYSESERMKMSWWGLQIALFIVQIKGQHPSKTDFEQLKIGVERVSEGHATSIYQCAQKLLFTA